ncbi:hypothetical protein CDL15_Pgr016739 [Punica granatum]|uniref:Uncharacterized protein n=1 Tax=Punica granatum TaxID=22663 RepID=A0A218WZ42_PUNGR|nr:hypothetical protein CDL15_Pgr016739 [Punica granatum]
MAASFPARSPTPVLSNVSSASRSVMAYSASRNHPLMHLIGLCPTDKALGQCSGGRHFCNELTHALLLKSFSQRDLQFHLWSLDDIGCLWTRAWLRRHEDTSRARVKYLSPFRNKSRTDFIYSDNFESSWESINKFST